jgi:hypothetical protein
MSAVAEGPPMMVITEPGRVVVDLGGVVVEPWELDGAIWRMESGTT